MSLHFSPWLWFSYLLLSLKDPPACYSPWTPLSSYQWDNFSPPQWYTLSTPLTHSSTPRAPTGLSSPFSGILGRFPQRVVPPLAGELARMRTLPPEGRVEAVNSHWRHCGKPADFLRRTTVRAAGPLPAVVELEEQ